MKIYVITVCKNPGILLRDTVDSVNALRHRGLYYLVQDGNSSDGTKEYLTTSGCMIDYWASESDDGIYDAMNKAILRLPLDDGHTIFLGAGDKLLAIPDPCELRPNEFTFGNVLIGNRPFVSRGDWRLRAGNTIHHQAAFYPTHLLKQMGFNSSYSVYGDFDLNQRLLLRKTPFHHINQVIAFAQPGGISWQSKSPEMRMIARKNFGTVWGVLCWAWSKYRDARSRLSGAQW